MHPLLRAAADRRLGVFTAADARRAGYDHSEIRRLCGSGAWRRLRRGVYVAVEDLERAEATGRRRGLDALAVLVALGRPAAALSHLTACHLWDLPVPRAADPVVRLTDPSHSRTGRGFRVTCGPLDDGEVRTDGPFRLTAPARTLVDCAREVCLEDAVVAMDAALLRKRLTTAELVAAATRAARWPGGTRAARAVSLTDGRAESPLETRVRLRVVGAGLPAFDLQREVWADGRMIAVADLWFDESAVAVHVDGRVKYTDPWGDPGRVLWDEKRREDTVRRYDVGVVRVTSADLTPTGWPPLEARLRELTSRPGPAHRRFTTVRRPEGRLRTG
ncbi:type IV toxin-antitoxin system AbiEi family antitoxin domain-containing protein [Blastococcus sp. URHD0036]|uniref:type IV toxin-antitoxin system AbiEi family antitoxin domain-containing protein n=1 Tax=Blastococcus sp. URHD0036 TaxID=1380356 RepID=UPI00049857DD|nr:type IV toxin-antitoxin system AbiEi family antitoxin domain-containing protein [Blastococcus sp. URHD0036]